MSITEFCLTYDNHLNYNPRRNRTFAAVSGDFHLVRHPGQDFDIRLLSRGIERYAGSKTNDNVHVFAVNGFVFHYGGLRRV